MVKLMQRAGEVINNHFRKGYQEERWDGFLKELDDDLLAASALERETAKEYFTKIVKIVEIEPHGYCNRVCSFCTNSIVDRKTRLNEMPAFIFDRILRDLHEIKYSGEVRLARYSEPLAHDGIYEKIKAIRAACPESYIKIISNGDYITKEVLERLAAVGLSRLHVSIYLGSSKKWSIDAAQHQIDVFTKRIGKVVKRTGVSDTEISQSYKNEDFSITCNCADYGEFGFDRGGVLSGLTDVAYVRRAPCMQVFHNVTIDYDGTIMPCCNVRGDIQDHQQYALGKLTDRESGLFEIFGNSVAQGWRRSLSGFSEKDAPCRSCKQIIPEGKMFLTTERKWNRRFVTSRNSKKRGAREI